MDPMLAALLVVKTDDVDKTLTKKQKKKQEMDDFDKILNEFSMTTSCYWVKLSCLIL